MFLCNLIMAAVSGTSERHPPAAAGGLLFLFLPLSVTFLVSCSLFHNILHWCCVFVNINIKEERIHRVECGHPCVFMYVRLSHWFATYLVSSQRNFPTRGIELFTAAISAITRLLTEMKIHFTHPSIFSSLLPSLLLLPPLSLLQKTALLSIQQPPLQFPPLLSHHPPSQSPPHLIAFPLLSYFYFSTPCRPSSLVLHPPFSFHPSSPRSSPLCSPFSAALLTHQLSSPAFICYSTRFTFVFLHPCSSIFILVVAFLTSASAPCFSGHHCPPSNHLLFFTLSSCFSYAPSSTSTSLCLSLHLPL